MQSLFFALQSLTQTTNAQEQISMTEETGKKVWYIDDDGRARRFLAFPILTPYLD